MNNSTNQKANTREQKIRTEKTLDNISFAEKIKSINAKKLEEIQNPNIAKWENAQRKCLKDLKTKIIEHFEWVASFGGLFPYSALNPYHIECWGEESDNIPNADELTKNILENLLSSDGITVNEVFITQSSRINAVVVIKE